MISPFVDIEVVFFTLVLCASGYYFFKPVAKHENNTDKTVLITGCDSGFGKGLVISATNAGFNVIAACYSEQAAKEFDNNSDVVAVVADLTKKEDIDYNKHIESVIVKITAVMSLYLLIERVNGSF